MTTQERNRFRSSCPSCCDSSSPRRLRHRSARSPLPTSSPSRRLCLPTSRRRLPPSTRATGLCWKRVFGLRWGKGRSGVSRAVMRRTRRLGSSSKCLASEYCNPRAMIQLDNRHVPQSRPRARSSWEIFGDLASDSLFLSRSTAADSERCSEKRICSPVPGNKRLLTSSFPTFDWVGSRFPKTPWSDSRTRPVSASDALATLAYAPGRRTVDFGRQEYL